DDLLLTTTRTDGLVVDTIAGDFLVFGSPLGIDRIGEGSTRARQVGGLRGDARGGHDRQASGALRQNSFEHVFKPFVVSDNDGSGSCPEPTERHVRGL